MHFLGDDDISKCTHSCRNWDRYFIFYILSALSKKGRHDMPYFQRTVEACTPLSVLVSLTGVQQSNHWTSWVSARCACSRRKPRFPLQRFQWFPSVAFDLFDAVSQELPALDPWDGAVPRVEPPEAWLAAPIPLRPARRVAWLLLEKGVSHQVTRNLSDSLFGLTH